LESRLVLITDFGIKLPLSAIPQTAADARSDTEMIAKHAPRFQA